MKNRRFGKVGAGLTNQLTEPRDISLNPPLHYAETLVIGSLCVIHVDVKDYTQVESKERSLLF
ncbi:hypothetical protein [Microseira sp. BLCC-F43]|uniref:hypothetical protein n=1 Tax=Microseira sp. BLCC-F43 TaxID=3153602 RepID=UPI0035B87746